MNIICSECGAELETDVRQMGTDSTMKVSPCDCIPPCTGSEDCPSIDEQSLKIRKLEEASIDLIDRLETANFKIKSIKEIL